MSIMSKPALIARLIIKLAFFCGAVHASPLVVTSIKPLYNLTAAISDGVFTPVLLVDGNISEHDFQLKPSQINQINAAQLIFWIGPNLETALNKPLANIPESKAISMLTLPGIKLLPMRQMGVLQASSHTHDHHDHDHDHGDYDPHIWLSLDNALVMIKYIANKLCQIDPDNAAIYNNNLAKFTNKLEQQENIWQEKLLAIKDLPIVVMHDAYQYFNNLNIVGTIMVDHDLPPSVKHIRQIKQVLLTEHVKCICSEPQLNSLIVKTLTEDHKIKHVVVDPLGYDQDLGPNGYINLIDKLTNSFYSCKP
jgi:zinc transport system substrate-binding protein